MVRALALVAAVVVSVCASGTASASPNLVFSAANMKADGTVVDELPAPVRLLTVQLPGMSHHFDAPTDRRGHAMPGRKFNEQNWGIGIQLERGLGGDWQDWISKSSFGLMKDSLNAMGVYAGHTWQRRALDSDSFTVDFGGGAFLFYRTLQFDGEHLLVPALLPVLSVTHKQCGLGVNLVAVPRVRLSGGTMPGVMYLQFTKAF